MRDLFKKNETQLQYVNISYKIKIMDNTDKKHKKSIKKSYTPDKTNSTLAELKKSSKKNVLKDIWGTWPGDESIDDLIELLKH